jgi:hypothetical protein
MRGGFFTIFEKIKNQAGGSQAGLFRGKAALSAQAFQL